MAKESGTEPKKLDKIFSYICLVCKCQYKNVQKWQNKNVQLFKTNMIF